MCIMRYFLLNCFRCPSKRLVLLGEVFLTHSWGQAALLIAANQLNRRGLGIEISKEYVNIAESGLETPQLYISI